MSKENPQRQDNPDELWKMIQARDKQIYELKKYADFYEMLRGLFQTDIISSQEVEREK